MYEDRLSIATPEGVTVELTLAGIGSRFIATMIDQLIQWTVIVALVLGVAALAPDTGDSDIDGGSAALAVAVFFVFLFAVQWGYDVLFETLASGRTPGKRLTGLRVVRIGGEPVGFVSAAVRNLVRLVDMLPGMYAVGLVAILVSPRNQRLGDMAAGTVVVRERRGGHLEPATSERAAPIWPPPSPPPSQAPSLSPQPAPPASSVAAPGGWPSSPPLDAAFLAWDVSAITPDELATVRRFLERRPSLTAEARTRLALDLAERLRPKVAGLPPGLAPEAFLEGLSAAKASRA